MIKTAVMLFASLAASLAFADPVYKCTVSGKTLYSNEPCVGAQRIDATPPRGFNKSSGQVLKGKDVRQEEIDEMLEKIAQTTLGQEWNQQKARKRQFHTSNDKAQCARLDLEIEQLEAMKKANQTSPTLAEVQKALFQKRKTFRDLDC